MRRISSKTVNICGINSSLEEAFEFCWSSLADEHNNLPKSTRRHVKLDKFVFGTPWLADLLCKHWFASSVWNFCRWVADVPPRETSPEAKSEEKRMFSQARHTSKSRARLTNCTYYMSFLQSFEALLTVRHVLISSQLQLKTCCLLLMGVWLKELQSNLYQVNHY